MAKKVSIAHPRAVQNRDDWVNHEPELQPVSDLPLKRISVDVTEDLHTRIKLDCVAKHIKMADAIRELLEHTWPKKAEAA